MIFLRNFLLCLTFHFEGESIGTDLLDHSQQTIAAGGGEVFVQTDFFNKIQFGVKYLLRGAAA